MHRIDMAAQNALIDALAGTLPPGHHPHLDAIRATSETATAVFGRQPEDATECHAWLLGLPGAASLTPWIRDGIRDVEQLARRAFEEEFGDGWREEWERRLAENAAFLEGRLGARWLAVLSRRTGADRQRAAA